MTENDTHEVKHARWMLERKSWQVDQATYRLQAAEKWLKSAKEEHARAETRLEEVERRQAEQRDSDNSPVVAAAETAPNANGVGHE